jgi:hypothetical protein
MARSSIALFLASATLIAGLSGCGGEGDEDKKAPADSSQPMLGAPQGGEGEKPDKPDEKDSRQGEGGEGGEGGEN